MTKGKKKAVPSQPRTGSAFVKCERCGNSVYSLLLQNHLSECSKQQDNTTNSNNVEKRKFDDAKSDENENPEPTSPESKPPMKKSKMEDSESGKLKDESASEENTWWKSPTKPTQKPNDNNVEHKETESLENIDISNIERPGILQYLEDPSWLSVLAPEFSKPYFKSILSFLEKERNAGKTIYPPENDIFTQFNLTPFDQVKAVILGQDPYHQPGQAHGLCFSVRKGVTVPPSLRNIYKELSTDIPGFKAPSHGFLESWAKQGVLMLNATLTVERGKPNSHEKIGWGTFTDNVIKLLSQKRSGIVFILWGSFAKQKSSLINKSKRMLSALETNCVDHVVTAAHPSPLAGNAFLGCKSFSKCNSYLEKQGVTPIDWRIPD